MDKRALAGLALFVVNLLYGINYVVAKSLMAGPSGAGIIAPSGFILLRVLGATVLFWLVRLFVREQVQRKDMPRIALCALFGVAINQLMFFHGLARTSGVHASIIMVATPIMVLVLSGIILRERITAGKSIGVFLGATGAVILITLRSSTDTTSSFTGDLYILINATSYAVFLVLVKPLMSRYSAVTVMAWCFGIGGALVLPFGLREFQAVDWGAINEVQWSGLAFVVVMVTFVAYLLNTWALRTVDPSVAGTYIYLQPVLALLTTYFMPGMSVHIGPYQLLAAVCIFTGVHLVGRADGQPSSGKG